MELVPSGTKELNPREHRPKIVGIERRRLNSTVFRKEKRGGLRRMESRLHSDLYYAERRWQFERLAG